MLSVRHIAALAEDAEFVPTNLGGCVLWLSDDSRFVVLAQPSVTYPKDLSQSGTWARTGLTSVTHGAADPDGGTSADTLLEDSSTGVHFVTQTLGAVVTGIPGYVACAVKAGGSGTARRAAIQVSGGIVYLNPATGTVDSSSGVTDISIVDVGNGWRDIRFTVTSVGGSTGVVALANPGGAASYTGDGTGRNLYYNFRFTQNRVWQWGDRTVNANHFTQATAANQPRWVEASRNGRPAIVFDGSNDFLVGPAGSSILTASAGSMIIAFKPRAVTLHNATVYGNDSIFSDTGADYGLALDSTGPVMRGYNFDGTVDEATPTLSVAAGTPYVADWHHKSGTMSMALNDGTRSTIASGNTSGLASTMQLAACQSIRAASLDVYEVIGFNRAITAAERTQLVNYLRAKWSI